MKNQLPVGRPKTPEYRKKSLRYSKVEDTFLSLLSEVRNETDRRLIMKALMELRGGDFEKMAKSHDLEHDIFSTKTIKKVKSS